MDRLLEELSANGTLEATGVQWAQAHQREHGGDLDSVLLELDLVDEQALLRGLSATTGLPAAAPEELARIDSRVGESLPQSFSRSFLMCPVRAEGDRLVALVHSRLPAEWVQELRDLFGIEVEQLVAPAHYLTLAREKAYGTACPARARELELRLARRRAAPDVNTALARLTRTSSFSEAIVEVFEFAGHLVEACCMLVERDGVLHCVLRRDGTIRAAPIPPPDPASALAPAIRHGGYFLGPVGGSEADAAFFASLERPVPHWAFVAPVPAPGGAKAVLCADNGPRGIAAPWVAELTLLAARVGQVGGENRSPTREQPARPRGAALSAPQSAAAAAGTSNPPVSSPAVPVAAAGTATPAVDRAESSPPAPESDRARLAAPAAAEPSQPEGEPSPPVGPPLPEVLSRAEQRALERLRAAARDAGIEVGALVDQLLAARPAPVAPEAATAVVTEVKGLFEKLATDIPTQLARGMELAFRDLVPKLAASPAPAAAPPPPAAPAASAAAGIDLVVKEPAKREVADYRARRKKSARRKL